MSYYIDIQNATNESLPVREDEIIRLASLALRDYQQEAELTVRLVTPEEMIHLNHTYRKQNKTTNVLAFPSELPPEIQLECPLLGDVIICPQVLLEESKQLKKTLESHWALILIHGILHLLGYDHIKDDEAAIMQAIEIKLLAELGFPNPYDAEGNELE
ncbi:rRNA maturation RNase YbeY [Fluoribacter gormanii]|uniref:Endoribonuclease YbeY n=1 Tax=Fluoribacter gormanii TaxID=464 RepID=A0A377GKP0_9GAMM|nr:rRNA maturation RNase YbeY [Fluoribacter gormanii]KTD00755.1 metal-dependent hydrolase [Fluoribacter gormanii]MCW8443549.1 rRNA maturation RNase YbeY [Fluoribacter gormanii]MCW8471977.1 rRNA maturation RNase YbeY [Fluoribacter gormanii]SIQ75938.1 probable rRNA maturation factor [Fluoribacter gormanii]STO24902.1 Probable rRNA maturation factor [Fluoribacter gormanii]